jgi:hypothetical protein
MPEGVIGEARIVDGTTRPVFADGERQSVMDEGERVYGLFVLPEEDRGDVPVIMEEAPERER